MSVILHFLWVVLFLGAWFGLGFVCDKVTAPFFALMLRGLRAAVLTLVFCAFLAAALANSAFIVVPGEARTSAFFVLLVGLGMIGCPIGFLAGVARGQGISED